MKEPHPHVIVVATDFSAQADLAVGHALEIARHRRNTAVHVVAVGSPLGSKIRLDLDGKVEAVTPSIASTHLALRVSKLVREHRESTGASEIPEPVSHIATGSAADEILRLAADLDADEIVLGTHGRTGLRRVLLGSVAQRVSQHAHCTVTVVRDKAQSSELALDEEESALLGVAGGMP